ncbi:MAG: pinensin family lanthipeptide [Bacteroidetes bacterium]|nr:pinensin family lanthipeptide [Bacteroidota bacterium]
MRNKLSLQEIQVKSFVTNLHSVEKQTIGGGNIAIASAAVSATTTATVTTPAPTVNCTVAYGTAVAGLTCVIVDEMNENNTFTIGEGVSNAVCADSHNIFCGGMQTQNIGGCMIVSFVGGTGACLSAKLC